MEVTLFVESDQQVLEAEEARKQNCVPDFERLEFPTVAIHDLNYFSHDLWTHTDDAQQCGKGSTPHFVCDLFTCLLRISLNLLLKCAMRTRAAKADAKYSAWDRYAMRRVPIVFRKTFYGIVAGVHLLLRRILKKR